MNVNAMTFNKTLDGLSKGLQTRHVATFELQTCAPDECVIDALERFPEYDQIPVKETGCIIGVVERNGHQCGSVRDHMRRLDDGILVSADEPLLDFVPLMAKVPFYRLVLSGTRVDGVVTRSDLLKLPVRLLAFALVTNLELLMQEIIAMQISDEAAWLAMLSEGRRDKVKGKKVLYQEKHMDPALLELTDFCDKTTILKKHLKLSRQFGSDMGNIENLRNLVAHAANYASGEAELQIFIDNLQKARYWIEELSHLSG